MPIKAVLSSIVLVLLASVGPNVQAAQAVTMEELQKLLKERDAAIIELQTTLRSVLSTLERLDQTQGDAATESPVLTTPSVIDASSTPTGLASDVAEYGRIAVDELAAERALERTLAQAGALLLPAWRMEVTPSFGYAIDTFESAALTRGSLPQVEREIYNVDLEARLGLPFDTQLEIGLPYTSVDETVSELSGTPPVAETFKRRGSGIGSLRLGIAKTFLRERGWRPDLIGRLTWNTGTGDRTDNDVFIGGFESVAASISAIKRADPVVFVGALNYETFSKEDGVDPGNLFSFSLGTALAVSPSSSFSASISNRFFNESRIDGRKASGTDLTSVLLNLGVSTIIARDVLVGINTGIGVSADAPDYTIGLSTTFRSGLLRRVID